MQNHKWRAAIAGRVSGLILIAALAAATALLLPAAPVQADPAPQETEKYCLSCHGNPDLKMALPGGEEVALFVSQDDLAHSVHSPLGIECQACHTEIKTYPHPPSGFQNRREMTFKYSDACAKCHSTQSEKAHDSIHQQMIESGNLIAPVCADCHGAHKTQPPGEPRAAISNTCGTCHTEINAEYRASIHGQALIDENNEDAPVCTDCHGVHNIQDPRTADFRVAEPDLCAGCHSDPDLMGKYGISADVYGLYNTSWHGVDVAVYKARWPTVWHDTAVCSDCHGVHNIRKTEDPASKVNPQNRLATCQQCHPGVGQNWLSAWVGHNRIDRQQTPALYYTEQFYSGLAPAVLWISLGYVFLQALHALIERIRRSLP